MCILKYAKDIANINQIKILGKYLVILLNHLKWAQHKTFETVDSIPEQSCPERSSRRKLGPWRVPANHRHAGANFYNSCSKKLDNCTNEKSFPHLWNVLAFLVVVVKIVKLALRRMDPRSRLSIRVTLSKFSSNVSLHIFRWINCIDLPSSAFIILIWSQSYFCRTIFSYIWRPFEWSYSDRNAFPQVFVNGIAFGRFNHRFKPEEITHFRIHGDIEPQSATYHSISVSSIHPGLMINSFCIGNEYFSNV